MKSLIVYGPVVGLLLAGCASVEQNAPPVAQLHASSPALCEQGRQIYVTTCTKCHSAEAIRPHPLVEWRAKIMPAMAKKSKITAQQEAAVMAYVEAVINTPLVPKPQG